MIDLHLHTNHSDGTDSVKELLQKAEKNKLEVISITDHDSVGAYYEIEQNADLLKLYNGKIIVGAELKAIYNKINIEVLAYGMDYKKIKITKVEQEKIQNDILQHFFKVAKELNIKFDPNIRIDINDSSKQFASSTFSEEILKYEENKEIFEKIGEFSKVTFYREHESNINSPFYFDSSKYYKTMEEVIDDIHNAGGLAFLAHGFLYPFENKEKELENILASSKIDGAECEYPMFTQEQRKYLKDICKKYNKFMSGGSDYHANNKPTVKMGSGENNNLNIDKNLIQDWIDIENLKILHS